MKRSKAEAARENGKKGGRPRKRAEAAGRQRSANTGLTRLQERFVNEYVANPQVPLAEVYRKAGFRASTPEVARANAGKLLRLHHVARAIQAANDEARERAQLDGEEELRLLRSFMLLDPACIYDSEGNVLPVREWPVEARLALEAMTPNRYGTRFEFSSKIPAAEIRLKVSGRLREHVDVSHPVPLFALAVEDRPDLSGAPVERADG